MTMLPESNLVPTREEVKYELVEIPNEVIAIVKSFYPDVSPQLALQPENIENIMNCDSSAALDLMRKIKNHSGREIGLWGIFVIDFCEYLGVDELLIQLFLASLRTPQAEPTYLISITPKSRNGITFERPKKLAEMIEYLRYNKPYDAEILQIRVNKYKELYWQGEPMYKRDDNYRAVIYPDEAAQILRVHLRTAQQMFRDFRAEHDLPKRSYISVKKFCVMSDIEEEDVRRALAAMYGED